jgi:hypothetical protein
VHADSIPANQRIYETTTTTTTTTTATTNCGAVWEFVLLDKSWVYLFLLIHTYMLTVSIPLDQIIWNNNKNNYKICAALLMQKK